MEQLDLEAPMIQVDLGVPMEQADLGVPMEQEVRPFPPRPATVPGTPTASWRPVGPAARPSHAAVHQAKTTVTGAAPLRPTHTSAATASWTAIRRRHPGL